MGRRSDRGSCAKEAQQLRERLHRVARDASPLEQCDASNIGCVYAETKVSFATHEASAAQAATRPIRAAATATPTMLFRPERKAPLSSEPEPDPDPELEPCPDPRAATSAGSEVSASARTLCSTVPPVGESTRQSGISMPSLRVLLE